MGVAVYVNSDIPVKRRLDLETPDIELIWVELLFKSHKFLICVCYRPPGQSVSQVDTFVDSFYNSVLLAAANNNSLILLGDCNDGCQSWDSDHNNSELKLVNAGKCFDMTQLINEPARNQYILDLLITDSPDYIVESGVLPPISNFDHNIIYCHLKTSYSKNYILSRKIWLYDEGNYDLLNNFLLDWDTLFYPFTDINEVALKLTELRADLTEICIPSKIIKNKFKINPV